MQSESATILWGLILTLHLLSMAVWVGGLGWVLFILRPSIGLLDQTQRISVHLQSLKRFFRLVWHVMPISLLTGWAMEIFREGGFKGADWHVNAMQGLAIVMALVFAYTYFGPFKKAQRALRPKPGVFESIHSLASTSFVLAILIVVVASLGHTY